MKKEKLHIIELELGIDVTELSSEPELHQDTKDHIDLKIRLAKQETDAIEKFKKKKEQQKSSKEQTLETCYQLLLKTNAQSRMPIKEFKKYIGELQLSSIILMLKKLMKQRGNLWKIKKTTKNKEKYYHIEPL